MDKKTLVGLLIVIVSFLGILDASYLSYEKLSGYIPPCLPGFHCGTVLSSPWSMIGPFPLPVLGLFFYTIFFSLSIYAFLDNRHIKLLSKTWHVHDLLLAFGIFGAFFSAYLVMIMGVILKAWCIWCLVSASFCATLFLLNFMMWWMRRNECACIAQSPRRQLIGILYLTFLKPLFFLLDPEYVHEHMVAFGAALGRSPLGLSFLRFLFSPHLPSSPIMLNGILFPGRVGLSAGFDYNADLPEVLSSLGFGFGTIGTITKRPYEGNKPPRLGRLVRSRSLLVNKGFKNLGISKTMQKLKGKTFDIPIGLSIGNTNAEYKKIVERIEDIVGAFLIAERSKVDFAYYELNISCPNTKGGQPFVQPKTLNQLVHAVDRLKVARPIFVKMPIDLSDKEATALLDVLSKSSVSGVIFGNLTKDKTNPDVHPKDREVWKHSAGNLSGFPTFRRSNTLIALTKRKFGNRFTIIGTGGIFTPRDAETKLRLGADLVQLITGMIYQGPSLIGDINHHLGEVLHTSLRKPKR